MKATDNEIVCPHCSKLFKIDESGYADILKQVHDHEFEKQLSERLTLAEKEKKIEIELAKAKAANEFQQDVASKDAEIQSLKSRLEGSDAALKLAVTEALSAIEKERDALKAKVDANEIANKLAITEAVNHWRRQKIKSENKVDGWS